MPGGPVKRNGKYTPNGAGSSSAKTKAPASSASGPPAKPLQVKSPVSSLTGGQTVHTPVGDLNLNVRALQNMLVKHGYDVGVDGKLGPQTLSALRDWYRPSDAHNLSTGLAHELTRTGPLLGKQDASAWNKRFGTPATRSPVFRTPNNSAGGSLDQHGNDVTAQYAPPGQDVNLDPQAKAAADFANTVPISEQLANYGKMIDPKTADSIAGAQFDPQIREAQLALAKDPLIAKTNLHDVGSWYGDVLKSEGTAATRDAAASKAGTNSISDATQALIASLGGSANMGSGEAAAAGANASGTLAAEGAAQDQYNNDLAPILQGERASQLTNQAHKDSAQQQVDQLGLENLQGQRGQALTTAQDQILQENNALAGNRAQMLVGIKGQNNSLAQQSYQNSLALAQAQIAAMMSGLQVQTAQAKVAKSSHPNAFVYASPTVKNNAYQEALASLYDPTSHAKLSLTPQQAQSRVASVLSGFGWQPAPNTAAGQFGSSIINAWNTAG